MNIEKALGIQGWMEEADLSWLADHATQAHRIAEIGSWKGRSTTALAENTPGYVYAVDTWLGSAEHNPPVPGLHDEFRRNMLSYIVAARVRPMWMKSIQAAEILSRFGERFDMVFIDGAHDYASVHADILAWRPLLAPGALLCGHDIGHPPVEQAVNELLPNRPSNEFNMWLWRNP